MYGNVLKEFAAAQFLVTKLRDSYPPARSLAELTHIGLGALQPTEFGISEDAGPNRVYSLTSAFHGVRGSLHMGHQAISLHTRANRGVRKFFGRQATTSTSDLWSHWIFLTVLELPDFEERFREVWANTWLDGPGIDEGGHREHTASAPFLPTGRGPQRLTRVQASVNEGASAGVSPSPAQPGLFTPPHLRASAIPYTLPIGNTTHSFPHRIILMRPAILVHGLLRVPSPSRTSASVASGVSLDMDMGTDGRIWIMDICAALIICRTGFVDSTAHLVHLRCGYGGAFCWIWIWMWIFAAHRSDSLSLSHWDRYRIRCFDCGTSAKAERAVDVGRGRGAEARSVGVEAASRLWLFELSTPKEASHVGLKCYRYHTGDDESKWKKARGLDRRTREKVIRRWRIGVPLGLGFDDTIPCNTIPSRGRGPGS
ncbi:hypothetical protein B0H13DRAFT_1865851 [Mycena leptocephala]|nr:hypothetical protein B0H13DRAFT_1865851 [Mycena leptocephala]